MSSGVQIRLNHAGIAAILKSADMHRVVNNAGERVAASLRTQLDQRPSTVEARRVGNTWLNTVTVDEGTTDRARALVYVHNPHSVVYQVRDGMFTRAVAAAGLKLKPPRSKQ